MKVRLVKMGEIEILVILTKQDKIPRVIDGLGRRVREEWGVKILY